MMTEPRNPPSLRLTLWVVGITWVSALVGVVLALVRRDFLTAFYALWSSLLACCWMLSLVQWQAWRQLAIRAMGQLPWVVEVPPDEQ